MSQAAENALKNRGSIHMGFNPHDTYRDRQPKPRGDSAAIDNQKKNSGSLAAVMQPAFHKPATPRRKVRESNDADSMHLVFNEAMNRNYRQEMPKSKTGGLAAAQRSIGKT